MRKFSVRRGGAYHFVPGPQRVCYSHEPLMVAVRRAPGRRRLVLGLAGVLAMAVLAGAAPQPAPAALPSPLDTRALWVLRQSLTSAERIDRLVQQATASGFNTLILQVRARGDAFFAGSVEPRGEGVSPGFDPLEHALAAGHRAGLRVHVWLNVNLVASAAMLPTDPAHLVHTHPEWLMVPRPLVPALSGVSPRNRKYLARLAEWTRAHADRVEGLYASPISRDAARYLEDIVADLATRYAFDGLHLDYVRYPDPRFDFSALALTSFRDSIAPELPSRERARLDAQVRRAPLTYVDRFPARWADYRRHRLADLVARLRATVKKQRPAAWISAAVVPDPGEATRDRFQAWPEWARRGLIDAVCPMAYTTDADRFSRQIAAASAVAQGQVVWAGVGAYRMTAAQTVRHIAAARSAGAQGIVLFSYDSPSVATNDRDALGTIGRAAFGSHAVPVASSR